MIDQFEAVRALLTAPGPLGLIILTIVSLLAASWLERH